MPFNWEVTKPSSEPTAFMEALRRGLFAAMTACEPTASPPIVAVIVVAIFGGFLKLGISEFIFHSSLILEYTFMLQETLCFAITAILLGG